MKAVILAAGTCFRIRAITSSPKCLLRFNGRAILDYQLDSLKAAGVEELAIVLGYKGEEIVEHVARNHFAILNDITFLENARYQATNNIYSLWLAREWMSGSKTICLNADVLFHPAIIGPAVSTSADISMIVDNDYRDETMKVIIRDGYVIEMRKGIPREQASGTYIGVTTFGASLIGPLVREMELLLSAQQEREFFNVAVQNLVNKGTKVSYTSTQCLPWAEVDDPGDYEFAQRFDWGGMYETFPATGIACSSAKSYGEM